MTLPFSANLLLIGYINLLVRRRQMILQSGYSLILGLVATERINFVATVTSIALLLSTVVK